MNDSDIELLESKINKVNLDTVDPKKITDWELNSKSIRLSESVRKH